MTSTIQSVNRSCPAGLYRFLPVYKDLFVEKYIRGSPHASANLWSNDRSKRTNSFFSETQMKTFPISN